jgi:hypothetical protein
LGRLEESEAGASRLPSRTKYLLLVFGFLRRLLELHLQFVDDLERELASPDPQSAQEPGGPSPAQGPGETG